MEKVVITGTGLIAKEIAQLIDSSKYDLHFLSTSKNQFEGYPCYRWQPSKGLIDEQAIKDVSHIIHTAGSPIAQRWTEKGKQEIIDSRVKTAELLHSTLNSKGAQLKTFISASGVGYYGTTTDERSRIETDKPYEDFVSKVCIDWEKAAHQFEDITERVVILRTGVVLAKNEGALKKMVKPIQMGIGSPLGSGNQFVPWIHKEDIAQLYTQALHNSSLNGIYNAVATEHITNAQLTKAIGKVLGKKIWMPKVPKFLLKLIFGEMATIVLEGVPVSNQKLKEAGYHFKFDSLELALKNLYKKD